MALKRILDLLLAGCLLILTLPIFIITAIAIKLNSRGPVIFKQIRIGKDRKPFTCYKFRSMYVESGDEMHQNYIRDLIAGDLEQKKNERKIYKLTGDPRITAVGMFIRRLSIDELPQLFNVLKGQMSMIGPRPAVHYELKYYDETMLKRFSFRPGITGLWQVGGRSSLNYKEMVDLDIFYIEHWSILLDLKILLKTVPYVLRISHAY